MSSAAVTAEPKAKKKAEVSPEPEAPSASQFALDAMQGAPAGMPLFLGAGLQRKLVVGSTDDPLEREAGRIAEHVMRSSASRRGAAIAQPSQSPGLQRPRIWRKCACGGSSSGECEECRKHEEESAGSSVVLRRAKSHSNGSGHGGVGGEAPGIVHQALRSPGQPISPSVRASMESRFGHDFSEVRVHTDSVAAKSAQAVNALAYTAGKDVVFANGHYSPHSSGGERLLAHELAHVLQQSNRPGNTDRTSHTFGAVGSSTSPKLQRFGSTEHEELGNTTGVTAIDLGGGVVLTWGQIVALAGDYYGTIEDLQADATTPDGRGRIRAAMEKAGLPSVASTTLPAPGAKEKDDINKQYLQLAVHNIPHFLAGGTFEGDLVELSRASHR